MAANQSYRKLLLAALSGDWEVAKSLYDSNGIAYRQVIGRNDMNALHIAAANGHTKFVEKMVELMNRDEVLASQHGGFTALHLAAMGGHLEMTKALVQKNPQLTQSRDAGKDTPLICAVKYFSEYKLVRYLARETADEEPDLPFITCKAGELMIYLTHMGFHDISLYLIQRQQSLGIAARGKSLALAANDKEETILEVLAHEPAHFFSGTKLNFWQRWIYQLIPVHQEDFPLKLDEAAKGVLGRAMEILVPCIKKIGETKLYHERACKLVDCCLQALGESCDEGLENYFDRKKILYFATRYGIVEIVTASLHYFPDLIYSEHGTLLRQYAIQWRQENIFNLFCESTALEKILASCYAEHASFSHLAAELPKSSRVLSNDSTAASQMQREMKWYKAMERIQHPRMSELTSEAGETAFDIFSKNHKEMRQNAEKWMKDTSNSSMLVSTVIATMTFAAAFTLPGGNNDKGNPNFLKETSFNVFVCSDALALFSSVSSIWMFLSILTSSYREEDFVRALPKRMIIGLAYLFFALAAMMVAFGAGLAIIISPRFRWVWGPVIIFFAVVPTYLFIDLRLPLFIEMIKSTYGSGTIFHPEKIWKPRR